MKKIIIVLVILLCAMACKKELTCPTYAQKAVTGTEKYLINTTIMEYTDVLDAAIGQKGSTLSLVIIVRYTTSEGKAKELCDNHLRLCMALIDGENGPEKGLVPTVYDYHIGAYTPDEKVVIRAYKSKTSSRITWSSW